MIPVLFEIDTFFGPLQINSFGVMAIFAFLVPTYLLRKEIRAKSLDPDLANGIAMAAMLGGLVGARVYYIAERWDSFLSRPLDYIFTGAGLVWYGGLLGGTLAVAWYVIKNRVPFLLVADLAAPLLALGQVFGRMGCLLSGDGDYGPATDLPWAMSFPNGVVPTRELVHPTPIYDMLLLFLIFLFLWNFRGKQQPPGAKFGLYLVLLSVARIITEFYRNTAEVVLGLTMAQLLSVGLIGLGLTFIFLAHSNRKQRKRSHEAQAKA